MGWANLSPQNVDSQSYFLSLAWYLGKTLVHSGKEEEEPPKVMTASSRTWPLPMNGDNQLLY
jgi:hypothetical protein